jgi:hypothetical protein
MTVLPVATLGVINFLFALCWLVYVTFLGELLERVGLGKSLLVWFVILDQLVMAVADVAAGFASDRLQRLFGRLGPLVLGFNIVSCAAFLLMPHVTDLPPAVFVVLTVVWIATSSVLRAPLYVLLGRYPDLVRREWLAAVALIGLALAGAISPYLGLTLRQLDPVLPFTFAGVVLVVSVFGVPGLEKRLAVARRAARVRCCGKPRGAGAARSCSASVFRRTFFSTARRNTWHSSRRRSCLTFCRCSGSAPSCSPWPARSRSSAWIPCGCWRSPACSAPWAQACAARARHSTC